MAFANAGKSGIIAAGHTYTIFTHAIRRFLRNRCLSSIPWQCLSVTQARDNGVESRGILMIRHIPKVALLLGALAIAGQASADGRGWGGPGLVVGAVVGAVVAGAVMSSNQPRTVYVEPQPVYAPQPVYYQAPPPPVYYQPVVVAPAPVYYRPGYYGPPPGYYGRPHGYYGHDRDERGYRGDGPGRW